MIKKKRTDSFAALTALALLLVVGLDFAAQVRDHPEPVSTSEHSEKVEPLDKEEEKPAEQPLPIVTDRNLRNHAAFDESTLQWFHLDDQYDYVSDSSHGLIVVGQKQPEDQERGEAMDLFGLLDFEGNELLDCGYLSIEIAAEDMITVSAGKSKVNYFSDWERARPHLYGAYNFSGRQIVPVEYTSIEIIDDMIYSALNYTSNYDFECHYYNKQGTRLQIDASMSILYCAPNGRLVLVRSFANGSRYYMIADENGVPVSDFKYEKLYRNRNGTYICLFDGLYGLCDENLLPITDLTYKSIKVERFIAEGCYVFETDTGKGVWDEDLNVIIEPIYSTLEYFGTLNYAGRMTPDGERFGYLGTSGEEVVPLVYNWGVHPLIGSEEFVRLRKKVGDVSEFAYFDLQGNAVEPLPEDQWRYLVADDGAITIKNAAGQAWRFGKDHAIAHVMGDNCLSLTDERLGRGMKAKYGALGFDYSMITPPIYSTYVSFSITPNYQIAIVGKNPKGVLNRNGAFVVPKEYHSVKAVDDCTVIAEKDGRYQLLRFNEYAKPANCPTPIVLMGNFEEMQTESVDRWDAPLIKGKQEGLWGLYNADGVCLIDPDYDSLFYSEEIAVVVKERRVWVYGEFLDTNMKGNDQLFEYGVETPYFSIDDTDTKAIGNTRYGFWLTMPSDWKAFDRSANGDGYFIECDSSNVDIRVYGKYEVVPENEDKSAEPFVFDSGVVGWCEETPDEAIRFSFRADDTIICFYVGYAGDVAWFEQNHETIVKTAKTLRKGVAV